MLELLVGLVLFFGKGVMPGCESVNATPCTTSLGSKLGVHGASAHNEWNQTPTTYHPKPL